MEDGQEHRLRGRLHQPVERFERLLQAALTDRIGEGPDRARDRLRDERPDVVRSDDGRPAVQPELVQLHRREPGLVSPLGIAFLDEPADPLGQELRGARGEMEAALARLGLDPACEGGGPR